MAKKFIPTEKQLEHLRKMASNGATRTAMAKYINKDRCCLKRLIKDYDIKLKPSPENRQGKDFKWNEYNIYLLKKLYASDEISLNQITNILGTSDKTITNKARELGLNKKTVKIEFQKKRTGRKPSLVLDEEDKKYIIEELKTRSVKSIAKEYNTTYKVLYRYIKKWKVPVTHKKYRGLIDMPNTPELYEHLKNPFLSHAILGKKYNVSCHTIRKWRQELFGEFKTRVNYYVSKSSAEYDFELILEDIGLAYIRNYKVDNWVVDYFLGNDLLVEINGDYWHGKVKRKNKTRQSKKIKKTIKKDIRKKEYLTKKGFKLITIFESELKDVERIKELILQNVKESISKL